MADPTMEHVAIFRQASGMIVDAVALVALADIEPARLGYRIELDAAYRTRSLIVTDLLTSDVLAGLRADGEGGWTDATSGDRSPDLAGCIDVDLSVTAFTNSLPVWRLGLQVGESAEILAAWFKYPEIAVVPARQRYTRLDDGRHGQRYRYEGLDSDFVADLELDQHGLVLDYPRFRKRIWPLP